MSAKTKKYSRYSRTLVGLSAQGFFSAAAALAGDADLVAFQMSGAEGEIIVLDSDDAAQSGALTSTDEFTIAQKVDGEIKRSTVQTFGNVTVTKAAYNAPVLQKYAVGYNGTSGSLNITLSGALQEFVVSARELTPANQPFPIMEGRAVVKSGTPTEYAIASAIVQSMLSSGSYESDPDEPFAKVNVIASVAGTVGAVAATYQTYKGSSQVVATVDVTADITAGELIKLDGNLFKVESVSVVDSKTIILLDRPAQSTAAIANTSVYTGTITAFEAGEYGIVLEADIEPINFVVGAGEDLVSADITELVNWKQGTGAPWQVSSIEDETSVFAGATTINAQWSEDWGEPSKFIDPDGSTNYDLYWLKCFVQEGTNAAPLEVAQSTSYIVIATEAGSAASTSLDTIFGV